MNKTPTATARPLKIDAVGARTVRVSNVVRQANGPVTVAEMAIHFPSDSVDTVRTALAKATKRGYLIKEGRGNAATFTSVYAR